MLDNARIDHLLHEVRRRIACLHVLLQRHHLLLEFMDLLNSGLIICFLLSRRLLVGADLGEGSSSLARHFEHVGGLALGDCKKKLVKEKAYGHWQSQALDFTYG